MHGVVPIFFYNDPFPHQSTLPSTLQHFYPQIVTHNDGGGGGGCCDGNICFAFPPTGRTVRLNIPHLGKSNLLAPDGLIYFPRKGVCVNK